MRGLLKPLTRSALPAVLGALLPWSAMMATTSAQTMIPAEDSTSRLLVRYHDDTSAERAGQIERGLGATLVRTLPDLGERILEVRDSEAPAVRAAFARMPDVDFVEPDFVIQPQANLPNDPAFPTTYALGGGAWGWTMTHTTQAWVIASTGTQVHDRVLEPRQQT